MSDEKRPKVGVAIFVWRDGKVVFYERRGAHAHGKWAAPGGHLEFGESWEDCARREAMEELGVTIKNVRFLAVTNDVIPEDNKHYVSIWVEADLDQGEPVSQEPKKVINVGWYSLNNLPSPIFEPCWTNLRKVKSELFTQAP